MNSMHQHRASVVINPWLFMGMIGPGDPVDPDQDPPDDVGGDGPVKPGVHFSADPGDDVDDDDEPDESDDAGEHLGGRSESDEEDNDDDVGGDGPVKPGT